MNTDPNTYVLQQAIMKIDSFIQDVCELKDDDSDNRSMLEIIADTATTIEASLVNIYKNKTGDDELLGDIQMESIDTFPFTDDAEYIDILDSEIL